MLIYRVGSDLRPSLKVKKISKGIYRHIRVFFSLGFILRAVHSYYFISGWFSTALPWKRLKLIYIKYNSKISLYFLTKTIHVLSSS